MLSALVVSMFFIYLLQDEDNGLSNMKLNKLLYYAQGYHLRRHSCPLFSEDIQACDYGPVVPVVYKHYKK